MKSRPSRRKSVSWFAVKDCLPKLGQTVLVFEQGFGDSNNHWFDYHIATFIKNPGDLRKRVFAHALQVKLGDDRPWPYLNVTHWMPLPSCPPKPKPGEIETKYMYRVIKRPGNAPLA